MSKSQFLTPARTHTLISAAYFVALSDGTDMCSLITAGYSTVSALLLVPYTSVRIRDKSDVVAKQRRSKQHHWFIIQRIHQVFKRTVSILRRKVGYFWSSTLCTPLVLNIVITVDFFFFWSLVFLSQSQYNFIAKCQDTDCTRNVLCCQVHSSHIHSNHKTFNYNNSK